MKEVDQGKNELGASNGLENTIGDDCGASYHPEIYRRCLGTDFDCSTPVLGILFERRKDNYHCLRFNDILSPFK